MATVQDSTKLDIKLPPGNPTTGKGAYGLNETYMNFERASKIVDYLKKLDYGVYQSERYDCEDRAMWGISHARHKFPGVPLGIAVGMGVEGVFAGKRHACIILWYKDGDKIKHIYFDQEMKKEVPFENDLRMIIPFPADKSAGGLRVPPLDSLTNINGKRTIVLDLNHDIPQTKENIIKYLKDKKYDGTCKGGDSHSTVDDFAFNVYWKSNPDDIAFWALAHLRREFMGAPVGAALGMNSSAIMIIYKDDSVQKITYWDLKNEKEVSNFDANLIVI